MQACPLNNCLAHDPNANKSSLDDFSESFSPAIKSVVDFAKGIPGFTLLNQDDQVTLLKVRKRGCSIKQERISLSLIFVIMSHTC